MASAYLGEIQIFAGKIPSGWVPCDGRQLTVSQNQGLFGILGYTYGGDGSTKFALPDLRGRVPIGTGQGPGVQRNYVLGQIGGEETHTLTIAEVPSHSHYLQALPVNPATNTPVPADPAKPCMLAISIGKDSGGNQININLYTDQTMASMQPMDPHTINDGPAAPHENRRPYMALTYCICTQGNAPPPS